jgi:hypothetical protein
MFLVQRGGEVKYIYVVVLQCDGFFKYFCPVAQAPLSLIREGCCQWHSRTVVAAVDSNTVDMFIAV